MKEAIALLEPDIPRVNEELLEAYYEGDISRWNDGHFEYAVDMGYNLGYHQGYVDAVNKLKGETK